MVDMSIIFPCPHLGWTSFATGPRFYSQVLRALAELDIQIRIQARPNELDPAIPLAEDHEHNSYDAEAAHVFWGQQVRADRVLQVWIWRAPGFRSNGANSPGRCTELW